MAEQKQIRNLDEAEALSSSETVEVSAEDLKRWASEMRALKDSLQAERDECISIAEHYLAKLFHGHGAGGDQAITAIIHDIRARGDS